MPNGVEHILVRTLPDGRMDRRNTAAYLGVKEQTLANWATQGRGPRPIRIGRHPFYFLDDCDRFVAAARNKAD